jgi:UDP-N-acetylmuramate dehydrogenase
MHRATAVEKVATALKAGRIKRNIPLAPFTTLHIGGPAEMLIETHSAQELAETVASARAESVPVTILGEGSNVLISDNGIGGLVVINKSDNMKVTEPSNKVASIPIRHITPRWQSDHTKGTFKYEFADLDYDESDSPAGSVEVDSGASLPKVLTTLIAQGITGLQWFSGIPGTIGGAIVNNIHGGTHFFHEYVQSIRILTTKGKEKVLTNKNFNADYNKTNFQKTGDTLLSATLTLHKGDAERAQSVAGEWARRKSIQPRNSPGCAFSNITAEDRTRLGFPTTSVGYIVEHVLKMSEYRVGDAAISKAHHNFIVNEGNATAKDYVAVMKEIAYRAKKKTGISLKPEIFMLGFGGDETSNIPANQE